MRKLIFLMGLFIGSILVIEAQNPAPKTWTDVIIKDAQNPTPEEISNGLIPVIRNNKYLYWKKIDREDYVKVVSYKTANVIKYYENDSTGFYNTGKYNIWVTVVPEIKDFCSSLGYNDTVKINLRLRQRLGLLPNDDQNYFVELWVRPQDMFRPCPDNEITDNICGLCLPKDVALWYREWFNELRAVQYTNGNDAYNGYPWTELGYTYDWNNDNPDNIGASEFVIKTNVKVKVIDIKSTNQYCNIK